MPTYKSHFSSKNQLQSIIKTAQNIQKPDLVIKNGSFLDVFNGRFVKGDVAIHQGYIVGIAENYNGKKEIDAKKAYIVPGFIDAHVHIESSMMPPAQFQRAVLPRGTTTVIWDPHEISNVKGLRAIRWALRSTENLLLDVFIMLSSCVPATSPALKFETSGALLTAKDLKPFKNHPRVLGLAEMMNFPGVLGCDNDVLNKLMDFNTAKRDGHCPMLLEKKLNAYAAAGIHSDHECSQLKEAREQLMKGLHILIREGSCAKNADALLPLLNKYTSSVIAFGSDDRDPLDIAEYGHIDCVINKALKANHSPETVFRAASFTASRIYNLEDRGAIAPGYIADFCLVTPNKKDWQNGMAINAVYKRGKLISPNVLKSSKHTKKPFTGKNIHLGPYDLTSFAIPAQKTKKQKVRVIGVRPNQIITDNLKATLPVVSGKVQADLKQDVLKIAVFERHQATGNHTAGFVKNFGIKKGAIATSINHDSHNIIVVGSSDELMLKAVKALEKIDGGIVVVDNKNNEVHLPLPIGGLMTDSPPDKVAKKLKELKQVAKKIGCTLDEPFLQLAFLALPVIPSLKITDKNLIDVGQFKKVEVCVN
jgi:adenine deaminase